MDWKSGITGLFMSAIASTALAQDRTEADFQFPPRDKHVSHTAEDRPRSFSRFTPQEPENTTFTAHCELLSEDGQPTTAFIRGLGVESHMKGEDIRLEVAARASGEVITDEMKKLVYTRHLVSHGLHPEQIDGAAAHCRANFSDQFNPG